MNVTTASSQEEARLWQSFVESRPESCNYHRWGWKAVLENSFGWPTYYLRAEEQGRTRGVLPLVWQRSRLFGSFLTSLPFFNAGGILADGPESQQALLEEAITLAQRLGAKHLELRQRHDLGLALPTRTNKVGVWRAVEADSERMWKALPPKVRTDVRKAMKNDLAAEVGGEERLEDFYRVFVLNMRDLGTPVYSRSFFAEIFKAFPTETYINVVRLREEVIAASFLVGHRDTLEVPWSSSLRAYLPLQPNMLLYWRNLCVAGEKGYRIFDFGRSSVDSGTHRFKMQWGAEERLLPWGYWLRDGSELPQLNPENPRYRLAIRVWRKLPVAVTRWVGPRIVRCLP